MQSFFERLTEAIEDKKNAVCVGLDPRIESMPKECQKHADLYGNLSRFCKGIVDIVAPIVPVIKPNAAFFERYGMTGMDVLREIIRYAKNRGLLVILDGKRNDIGSTAEAYADGILGQSSVWRADAMTVNPYLGEDSVEPFIKVAVERNAGIYVLVKTSNPGSAMIQDAVLKDTGKTVAHVVAEHVEKWSKKSGSAVGAVVGATFPQQLQELRSLMPSAPFLVPGYGAQGGSAEDVEPAFTHAGAVVNNSRGIIYAWEKEPYKFRYGEEHWREAVMVATMDMVGDLGGAVQNDEPSDW